MLNKNVLLYAVATLALAGCGRNYSGLYRGTQTYTDTSGTRSVGVTLTVNQDTNDNISGNWTSDAPPQTNGSTVASQPISGQISGRATANGLEIRVTMTPATAAFGLNSMYGFGFNNFAGAPQCSIVYSGFLTATANRLTGSVLNSSGQNLMCGGMNLGQSLTIEAAK